MVLFLFSLFLLLAYQVWLRAVAGRCTAHSNTTWETVSCNEKRDTLCEMDIARYIERTNCKYLT